jgi:hypothetical protein
MLANQIATVQEETDSLDSTDGENVLEQFDQLIEELLAGKMQRCKFQTWEIDLLLDALKCDLGRFAQAESVLRQYQAAVHRHLENGATVPLRLSDFLASRAEDQAEKDRRRAASPSSAG